MRQRKVNKTFTPEDSLQRNHMGLQNIAFFHIANYDGAMEPEYTEKHCKHASNRQKNRATTPSFTHEALDQHNHALRAQFQTCDFPISYTSGSSRRRDLPLSPMQSTSPDNTSSFYIPTRQTAAESVTDFSHYANWRSNGYPKQEELGIIDSNSRHPWGT